MYFGLYSMSGIKVRIGFGFRKDPFGCNKGLFNTLGKGETVNKEALAKLKEEQQNAMIEKEIFDQANETQNAVKFRKTISKRKELLMQNTNVRERYDEMTSKFELR